MSLYYIILISIYGSIFADIISRKRMSRALYHYSTYLPYARTENHGVT